MSTEGANYRASNSTFISSSNEQLEDGGGSDDEIFAELEKEIDEGFDIGALRERRLEALKREYVAICFHHVSHLTGLQDESSEKHARARTRTDVRDNG